MDPEVMEEFKERHAKMTNLQSSLQSGDLASGCVVAYLFHFKG